MRAKRVSFAVIALIATVAATVLIWRRKWPCPSWLAGVLENPFVERVEGASLLLDRAGVSPGMRVLDVGAGPGRVSIPAAERVGPSGKVVAVDIQPAMLRKLQQRVATRGLANIETLLGDIAAMQLDHNYFDRALLVTVLGEVRAGEAALHEIYMALKPGGVLSITEILPSPHYRRQSTVRHLAEQAGFRFVNVQGNWRAYTMNFTKPYAIEQ